ncbi:MAG: M6 family metalloprotease domain-containing protein, partial [Acidobacteria bacterium]|nr:M6 family metalloprotease domain-containing protein [Acidobacteriota bacterium]
MKKLFIVVFFSITSLLLYSLEPPKPFELERLKNSEEFNKRQEFAQKLGNHKLKLTGRGEKIPGAKGLPTSGTPKIFVLLIDFNDYPHTIDSSVIKEMIFGSGNSANYPYESLKSYYERSSYGKLAIEGDLFGWYRASNLRDYYTNNAEGLIEEAINYYHSQGSKFDKYDNDGDGEVDYFAVFWTGPDTGWATFWWGWQGYFGDSEYLIDGKRLGDFSWQWEEDNPGTIIHETGHALGLPDYYDYDDSVGPKGGMGGLDMMDAVWGDHNAFSKWLLGWLNPYVVVSNESLILPPLSTNPYAVVLSRNFDGSDYGNEFFIVQNRQQVANDSDFAGSGIMVLHIDARRDCDGYTIFDNSYTEHKLVRVMEADGLEEIEKGRWGDAEDFYFSGNKEIFGVSTFPNSDLYNGKSSFVNIRNISESKEQMTADFSIAPTSDLASPQITSPQNGATNLGTTPEINWNSVSGATGYELEVHESQNTVYKSGAVQGTSFTIPSGKLQADRVYTIWLKAKGDGTSTSSSEWAKTYFSTGCEELPYFLAKTFFDPPCY